MLTKSDSFSENSETFKIAQLQIMLTPNPFQSSTYFNQTLDFYSASVIIQAGGTKSTPAVVITAYIDANNDVLTVDITSPSNTNYNVDIYLTSTLPPTLTSYAVPFYCNVFPTLPDTIVSTIPSGQGYQTNSAIIYHVNNVSHSIIQQTAVEQGLSSIYSSLKEWYAGRIYGLVVDAGNGTPFNRISSSHLQSVTSGSSFTVRVTALSEIPSNGETEFLSDLGTLVQNLPSDSSRWMNHIQYWSSFWARSYIFVNASTSVETGYAYHNTVNSNGAATDLYHVAAQAGASAAFSTIPWLSSTTRQTAIDKLANNLPGNMYLWLKADSITGVNDGSSINSWKDSSGNNINPSQSNTSNAALPVYYSQGWNGNMPSVRFNGNGSFLEGIFALGSQSTIFAVFNDTGSDTVCCSGVFFAKGSNNGIGTARNPPTQSMDDDDLPVNNNVNTIMVDWSGSGQLGAHNVLNRGVVGTAVYSASSSNGYVDGCLETSSGVHGGASTDFQIGTRNNELYRFFEGDIVEIIVYNTALNDTDRQSVEAYLASKWAIQPKHCKAPPSSGYIISQQWISVRYMEAIQSRNNWPIIFNGQQFVATLPDGTTMNANYRDWGSSSWHQNTRLMYGTGDLSSGDFDTFEPILEFYLNMLTFAQERTQIYFNHTGIFFTETKTSWGAYSPEDYGCSRPANYPVWLETNEYIHLDYGGDGGTPEIALFALDYLLFSNDTTKFLRYLPLVLSTADFFRQHYTNRSNGEIVIYPTQVLETYWCDWDTTINGPTNCCVNDLPTVSGLHTLVEKMLALPSGILTPQQITEIEQFQALLPPIPMQNNVLVGAEVLSSGVHNSEFVTGYAMHPYRRFTVGKNITQNLDLDPALHAFAADPRAMDNEGWNQGIMDAAFLGLTSIASNMLIERATGPTAPGYRYLSFTPHYQDYEPSANHLANFLTGLNLMLIQPVDDGFNGTFVLFPAWPCEWDVQMQLWGGLNSSVTIDYSNGQLNSFTVNPPERKDYFFFANCVTTN